MKVNRLTVSTETELSKVLDNLYYRSKTNNKTAFLGLIELMLNPVVIITSIHKLKSNKGSKTAGIDNITIDHILQMEQDEVIKIIQNKLNNYNPRPVRRVWIEKSNGKMRPLGIPTIWDRIIQECVRTVIEPILEAKFFKHSYGFRPMRDASNALGRIEFLNNRGSTHIAIEGDIEGFFDNVNHNIVIETLWAMGIKDKRVLKVIKKMLKAGVMDEIVVNEIGTPQGGIISPILANAYLHGFDKYIAGKWEEHDKIKKYTKQYNAYAKFKIDNHIQQFLIRYADDWVILTDTIDNAKVILKQCNKYLEHKRKLHLSIEKTVITDMEKDAVKFLGFQIRYTRSYKDKNKKVAYTIPNPEKARRKIKEITRLAFKIRSANKIEQVVEIMNSINQKNIGVANYWSYANQGWIWKNKADSIIIPSVIKSLAKFFSITQKECWQSKTIKAKLTNNLTVRHDKHEGYVPFVEYQGVKFGLTKLAFSNWTLAECKRQEETPYTPEGRDIYFKRTNKKEALARPDSITLQSTVSTILYKEKGRTTQYNFEYFMNRGYALNRDKGKCKICGVQLTEDTLHTHHKDNKLPMNEINKVKNLASTCMNCHTAVHNKHYRDSYIEKLDNKQIGKLSKYVELIG